MNKTGLYGYQVLVILAAMDNRVIMPEMDVINKYLNDPLTINGFEPEEDLYEVTSLPLELRKIRFYYAVYYINRDYLPAARWRILQLAKETIEAKGKINENELLLFLEMAKAFGMLNEHEHFQVPIIWSDSMKDNFPSNEWLSIALVETMTREIPKPRMTMNFPGPKGMIKHEVVFDNTKLGYDTATPILKKGMDHLKNVAQKNAEILLRDNHASISGKNEVRFSFLDNEILYFVLTDMRKANPSILYLGCDEWRYIVSP